MRRVVTRGKGTSRVLLALVGYKLVLDIACTGVYHVFSSAIATSHEPVAYVTSWILYIINAVLIAALVVPREDLPATLFCFLFILNGVGFYSLYGAKTNMTLQGFLTAYAFWTVFTLAIAALPRPRNDEQPIEQSTFPRMYNVEYFLFLVVAVIVVAFSGVYGRFRIFIPFDDVYSYRFDFLETPKPGIVSYLIRWTSGAALPYFLVRFLMTSKWVWAATAFFLGLLMYGIDGLKTTVVLYVAIVCFFASTRRLSRKHLRQYHVYFDFLLLLILAVFVNYGVYVSTGKYFLNVELYRVLIIPSAISDNYYNFIAGREPLLLRESIMRFFSRSPYDRSISYLVSSSSYQGHQAIANTGMFGDAYANFKFAGAVTYPILYALVMRLWQKATRARLDLYSISLGFVMIWNSINLSLLTWVLTGGVIIFMVLTFIANGHVKIGGRRWRT